MSAASEIKVLKDKVKKLLESEPKYRDSDRKLCSRVWADSLGGNDKAKSISVYSYLVMYAESKVYSADSITRARRLIQQKYPELRGASWSENHLKAVSNELRGALRG